MWVNRVFNASTGKNNTTEHKVEPFMLSGQYTSGFAVSLMRKDHGPTALVTSAVGERRNVMAAAWSMPVEFTPPRVAIVIDKQTYTRELVTASGAFGLCLPGAALIDLTYAVGSASGRTVDKFSRHGVVARTGPVLGVPLIESGCAAWLECRLIREPHTEDAYDTCFAEVVAQPL